MINTCIPKSTNIQDWDYTNFGIKKLLQEINLQHEFQFIFKSKNLIFIFLLDFENLIFYATFAFKLKYELIVEKQGEAGVLDLYLVDLFI